MDDRSPPTTEDPRLLSSWQHNAGAWTRAVREQRIESRRLATDAAILAAVRERRPARVLDMGCGEGWLCRALAEAGIDALGVDGAPALVDAARAAGGRFETVAYADWPAQPRRFGLFDAIVCNFALLDAAPGALLAALGDALAPGGALLIQTVHPWAAAGEEGYRDGWRLERFAAFGEGFAPMPWYFRTLESWFVLLNAAGLRLETVREPRHPDSGHPLSLLLVARRQ
ncbi:class I SAM-dependent methyltransferase [Pseudomonas mangiferae]|uniref:Class I SAM-dependent methyltransferase n=1 Tax=Pseudomonas mangiferae TaxID=2593654 RepID=A0A553H286_9PSED|nr:class I SAM-dependent methyltransferase [Pseudomonas mangiferae]TRX75868.1 class I SAM-dependent methyltransferase [Pseudomonas mangiferae]